MAEQALVKASNTQQPLACWGCGSFEHLWSNCPLRSQPAARAKARQAMTELFNNRSKNKQPPTPQTSQPLQINKLILINHLFLMKFDHFLKTIKGFYVLRKEFFFLG